MPWRLPKRSHEDLDEESGEQDQPNVNFIVAHFPELNLLDEVKLDFDSISTTGHYYKLAS
jgi:hypothetical protein